MKYLRQMRRLYLAATILTLIGIVVETSGETTAPDVTDGKHQQQQVTVIGLGSMGSAVAKCFASSSSYSSNKEGGDEYFVHAWTRSGGAGSLNDSKCEIDGAISHRVKIHETSKDALASSLLTIIVIDDWDSVVSFVNEHEDLLRSNDSGLKPGDDAVSTTASTTMNQTRTVVLFSTYSPIDIQNLESTLSSSRKSQSSSRDDASSGLSLSLVGGAIVGVPATICSQRSLIMTSSAVPALQPLGTTVVLESWKLYDDKDANSNNRSITNDNENDVGTAALMNMALVVTIFFGLVGHELAHLMIQRYGVSDEFEETYQQLASDVAIQYTSMLLPSTSTAMKTKNFQRMYAPTSAVLRLLRMVVELKNYLGITEETFLDAHIKTLEWSTNPTKDGPPAWTETQQAVSTGSSSRSSSSSSEL
mmetsp:Transcript_49859/g.120817  ORF Transcript_49859/g.120817 Transcript_49859/m.120817 type:complete len:419 (+) Transcript_49859:190-1446(+)